MGADAFIAFYGLRYTLSTEELEAVESRTDERIIAARRAKLHTHFGRVTEGEPHTLLIGTQLGVFGLENEAVRSVAAPELDRLIRDTTARLDEAGLRGDPALHLRFEAKY